METDRRKVLQQVFEAGTRRSYAKGETIIWPGKEAEGLFFVEEGIVKIYSVNDRAEQYIHILYAAGQLFPAILLISRQPRRVYYETLTDCVVRILPIDRVWEIIHQDTTVAAAFLSQMVDQLRMCADRIDNLAYKYARERLAYRLLFLAGRFATEDEQGGLMLPLGLTQQVIGESINVSRESVGREIDRWSRAGITTYRGRQLVILQPNQLAREVGRGAASTDWWGLQLDPAI